eukprot:SAG11_NODE_25996_length_351_cov_0.619048_1_plen_80_part_10
MTSAAGWEIRQATVKLPSPPAVALRWKVAALAAPDSPPSRELRPDRRLNSGITIALLFGAGAAYERTDGRHATDGGALST